MKYVPVPAKLEIHIHTMHDQPMNDGVYQDASDPRFGKPRPAIRSYVEFLIGRTIDDVFFEHGGKKEGVDAIELIQLARAQIKATVESTNGFHTFDDEVCKRLRHAILHPKGGHVCPPELEHNLIDWVLIWKPEPRSELPAVLAQPDEPTTEPS